MLNHLIVKLITDFEKKTDSAENPALLINDYILKYKIALEKNESIDYDRLKGHLNILWIKHTLNTLKTGSVGFFSDNKPSPLNLIRSRIDFIRNIQENKIILLCQELERELKLIKSTFHPQSTRDLFEFINEEQNKDFFESHTKQIFIFFEYYYRVNGFDLTGIKTIPQLVERINQLPDGEVKNYLIGGLVSYYNSCHLRLHIESQLQKVCESLQVKGYAIVEGYTIQEIACALTALTFRHPENRAVSTVCLDMLDRARADLPENRYDDMDEYFLMLILLITHLQTNVISSGNRLKKLLETIYQAILEQVKDVFEFERSGHFITSILRSLKLQFPLDTFLSSLSSKFGLNENEKRKICKDIYNLENIFSLISQAKKRPLSEEERKYIEDCCMDYHQQTLHINFSRLGCYVDLDIWEYKSSDSMEMLLLLYVAILPLEVTRSISYTPPGIK